MKDGNIRKVNDVNPGKQHQNQQNEELGTNDRTVTKDNNNRLKSSLSDLLNDFLITSPMVHFSDSFYSLINKMDSGNSRVKESNDRTAGGRTDGRTSSSFSDGVSDRSKAGQKNSNQTLSGKQQQHQMMEQESSGPSGRIYSYLLDIQVRHCLNSILFSLSLLLSLSLR